jgi:ATP-binding cassette subfamily F protein 3
MLSKANFLLLDEPTNHLDIASREALEQALLSYEGTLLIVSHDRYLINKLADRIYTLDETGTEEFRGNYDYYLERRVVKEAAAPVKEKPNADAYRLKKERESEIRKQKTRLKRTEQEIEQLEAANRELENKLLEPDTAADYEAAIKLTEEIGQNSERLNELYELWAELTEELAEEPQK